MLQVGKINLVSEFKKQITELKEKLFTGSFSLETEHGLSWKLYFRLGRISWQSGGINPSEQWQRHIKYFCYDLPPEDLKQVVSLAESKQYYQALVYLQGANKLPRQKINDLIFSIICESFLDVLLTINYQTSNVSFKTVQNETLGSILHLIEPIELFIEAEKVFKQWKKAKLGAYHPSYYPVIAKPKLLVKEEISTLPHKILPLIDGTLNLRSLALQSKKNIVDVTKLLIPLLEKEIIAFYPVETLTRVDLTELNIGIIKARNSSGISSRSEIKSLIVCVDDSPLVCQNLESIITKHGYNFLGIQDSLKAVPILLKNKPDFIFLDLMMPVTNGYELCSQLRRVPIFQDVPVVILTGKDGLVDRMRAKMVGSTDFLSKPVVAELVINMINKHINVRR